jgi:glutamate dehydrogenase/leucine dehydrogenase
VGAAAAYYQAQLGAVVVGIIDRVGGLLKPEGFTFEEIKALFLKKDGNFLNADNMLSFEEVNERIWSVGAEIFIPAAASRLITKAQVDIMKAKGLEVISCGANVPFADQAIFFGPVGEYTDSQVSVLPDFIANCGMARVFAYLMQANAEVSDRAIFKDTSKTIADAITKAHAVNSSKTQIAKTAFEIALNELI